MNGRLLLSGGSEFPRNSAAGRSDPSVLDKQIDPDRDRWEFRRPERALARVADLAICKGLRSSMSHSAYAQARHPGHNLPEQSNGVQPLRNARGRRIVSK